MHSKSNRPQRAAGRSVDEDVLRVTLDVVSSSSTSRRQHRCRSRSNVRGRGVDDAGPAIGAGGVLRRAGRAGVVVAGRFLLVPRPLRRGRPSSYRNGNRRAYVPAANEDAAVAIAAGAEVTGGRAAVATGHWGRQPRGSPPWPG